jgi:hypothetical protein
MKKVVLLVLALICFINPFYSQNKNASPPLKPEEGYKFTDEIDLKTTSVKDQANTNTCWSFATTSFIESELIRMGKGEYDLSEMYIIRENYLTRLKENYLRQGKGVLGEGGGLPHDWLREFREDGIVPDIVYPGINYGSAYHNHEELNAMVCAVASVPVLRKTESPEYFRIINSVLDTYLGNEPENFSYNGVIYTPRSFAESLEINPDSYVEISSYTHFPFYSASVLEVPDNWAMEKIYNVPLNELIQIMDYSLTNGYTLAWDGDVSEKGFLHTNGIATIPEETVTQEMRQEWYETSSTTDDHGMHVTGIGNDQAGRKYYKTKNSWGTDKNPLGGYLYMSENYVRAKTILILVNKNGIPPSIKIKLGI